MSVSSVVRFVLISILVIPIVLGTAGSPCFAQANTEKTSSGPRRQIATIIFAGLGGAILGLSTLSFYPRPQDKLGNIATGFAIGVIIGTTFVTYKAATNPGEMYGDNKMTPVESPIVPVTSNQIAFEMHNEAMNRLLPQYLTGVERPRFLHWGWTF